MCCRRLGQRLRAEFERGLALDVALSNADAAGPAFSNLLIVETQGGSKVGSILLGQCFSAAELRAIGQ